MYSQLIFSVLGTKFCRIAALLDFILCVSGLVMHEKWCLIGSKNERRGFISSALKCSSVQKEPGPDTSDDCEKQVDIVMESILTKVSQEVDSDKAAAVKNMRCSEKWRGQKHRKTYTAEFKYKFYVNKIKCQ